MRPGQAQDRRCPVGGIAPAEVRRGVAGPLEVSAGIGSAEACGGAAQAGAAQALARSGHDAATVAADPRNTLTHGAAKLSVHGAGG